MLETIPVVALTFLVFDLTNNKSYIMIGYCSFQMTTESNCLQILCQFFNQREAKQKLIAPFIIQLHFVECNKQRPRRVQISNGICTPEDQLERLSRNTQATNWIEVMKKILFAKRSLFSRFCLDRNLKVKNLN